MLSLCSLTTPSPIRAQGLVGNSAFALFKPDYPCSKLIASLKGQKAIAIQALWGTFGSSTACLDKLVTQFDSITINLAIDNGAGRRNKRLKSGEILRKYGAAKLSNALESNSATAVSAIASRAVEVCNFIKQYQSINWFINVGLETNETITASKKRVSIVRESCPGYQVVWNPMVYHGGTSIAGADAIELHGHKPKFPSGKMCIANLDGTQPRYIASYHPSSNTINLQAARQFVRKNRKRCIATFLWDGQLSNCLGQGSWIAPKSRQCAADSKVALAIRRIIKRFNLQ